VCNQIGVGLVPALVIRVEFMRIWPYSMLHDATPFLVVSPYSLGTSISRLSAETIGWGTALAPFSEGLVGHVRERDVALSWKSSFLNNSCKPVFYGGFHVVNGRVLLAGRFALNAFLRVVLSVWFGFSVLVGALALTHPPLSVLKFVAVALAMLTLWSVAGLVILAGKMLSRKDIGRVTNAVTHALGGKMVGREEFSSVAATVGITSEELLALCFSKNRKPAEDFHTCDKCGRTCLTEDLVGEVCPYCFERELQD